MDDKLSKGQQDYERRRAAKAGVSLDKWLEDKRRQQEVAAREEAQRARQAAAPAKPGLLTRLLDRAHRPLGARGGETKGLDRTGTRDKGGIGADAAGRARTRRASTGKD